MQIWYGSWEGRGVLNEWFTDDYNKAIHDLDASQIYKFGAFARAHDEANQWNEYNRFPEDKLQNGKQLKKEIDCAYWNLSKVFLLWWGSKLSSDEVTMLSKNTYEEIVPFGEDYNTARYINMKGFMNSVSMHP